MIVFKCALLWKMNKSVSSFHANWTLYVCMPAAYHHAYHCWLASEAKQGKHQFLDGRPDAAGSGVGGPVGGTLSSGLKKISQYPRAVIGDTALCMVLSFRWDVKWVS